MSCLMIHLNQTVQTVAGKSFFGIHGKTFTLILQFYFFLTWIKISLFKFVGDDSYLITSHRFFFTFNLHIKQTISILDRMLNVCRQISKRGRSGQGRNHGQSFHIYTMFMHKTGQRTAVLYENRNRMTTAASSRCRSWVGWAVWSVGIQLFPPWKSLLTVSLALSNQNGFGFKKYCSKEDTKNIYFTAFSIYWVLTTSPRRFKVARLMY